MKKTLIVVYSLLFIAAVMFAASCTNKLSDSNTAKNGDTVSSKSENKETGIDWQYNFDKGLTEAKEANKLIMVSFYADWCGWCKRMDKTTYRDKEVVDLSSQFVCVKVNTDKDRTTPADYGVRGLPTVVFLSSEGKLLKTVVGYRSSGYLLDEMKELI
ncbi:MAG: thioredoxin family protein [Endomicrobiales bacterium]|nr:thioredoxin family protein [Endomicrobiales bacterium]